jgi:hypothetical protein
MAYKLSVVQEQTPGQWAWQIVDNDRPGWVKRSLLSFRSSGLATAAGLAELKNLSRRNLEPARRLNVRTKESHWTLMLRSAQRLIGV